ncbi:MAG: hypothetical protein BMS9Abin01_0106 [Gammaproteobacteria bacterium]|nr:MAG: hypothetical protein BMS9Abin01_0106 [Gammaproteobacteria bacterium]
MSDLRSRLGALRQQSGIAAVGHDDRNSPEPIDVLRHRLQRVGAGRRCRTARRARMSDETLAARLGGRVLRDGVVLIRERLPVAARHGEYPLGEQELPGALRLFADGDGDEPRSCVFMDTETTGLAGGTGTLVFLLGLARFSDGALEVSQLFLTGFHGESAMLDEARAILRGADTLVTFNGRSFDSPLLATRYRLSGLCDPFAGLRHADLLHVTRRTFKHRWPDCRLQTAERRLLGVERVGDLPGCEAPAAWFEWVRHGRDDALSAVCSHNRLDLLSLAVLPAALQRSHDDPIASGANVLACARHLSHSFGRGPGDHAVFEYLHRHRARLDTDGLLELARLARRRREWSLAVELWEQLAAVGVSVAIEHLAKYYEHEQRNYERALQVTARLLARAPHDGKHRRRDARLRARLAGK